MKRVACTLVLAASLETFPSHAAEPNLRRAEDLAAAQPRQGQDPAAAEALFDDARRLMQNGQYAEACPKLEASQRLDPGVGTLLNLGDCLEHNGQRASAWARFREAASAAVTAGQPQREREARSRAATLEPTLAKIVLRVRPTDGLTIRRDDVVLEPELWGTPLPLDAGEHTLVASAKGHASWTTRLHVGKSDEGKTTTIEVPSLPPETASGGTSEPPSNVQRPIALGVGVTGLVALGVAGGFALRASALQDDAESRCTANGCNDDARNDARDAGRLADVATGALITGSVLVAAAAVLWVLSDPIRR